MASPVIDQPQNMTDTQQPFDTPEHEEQFDDAPRGCGCILPMIILGSMTFILLGLAFFLPPFNLYQRITTAGYFMLSPSGSNQLPPSLANGLEVVIAPENMTGEFGVSVQSVGINNFTPANTGAGEWVVGAASATPPYLALQSPVYQVQTRGAAPKALTISLDAPANVDPDVLDLYAWDSASGRWRFVPSQLDPTTGRITTTLAQLPEVLALFQALPRGDRQMVLAAVDITQRLTPEAAAAATIVAPAGLVPTPNGALGGGGLAPGFDLTSGYQVMPTIRNYTSPGIYDVPTVVSLIADPAQRAAHVQQITVVASTGGYDGIFIDYRDIPTDQRDNFSAFVTELGASLDSVGVALGVVVPAAQAVDGFWQTGAYDWRSIGQAADYVQINLPADLNQFIPSANGVVLVDEMLRWGIGEIERYKILLGLSALSLQQTPDGQFVSVNTNDALAPMGDVTLEIDPAIQSTTGSIPPGTAITARLNGAHAVSGMDERIQTPFIDYYRTPADAQSGQPPVARMWLTTGTALRYRMDSSLLFLLSGVAFEDLLANGVSGDVLPALSSYQQRIPTAPVSNRLALRWRIEGSARVISESVQDLGQPFSAPLQVTDEGDYTISVAVVGTEVESVRGGAAVAVIAPTLTPTPLPTSTPTPIPTITPTLNPATAAPPVAPVTGPVNLPGAGSISVGMFEYGGHVTSTSSERAAGAMNRAGMTWMKVQVRYSRGNTAGAFAAEINNAHARGFKVLLGVVGSPGEVMQAGYFADYANFVGQLAALGADAIEIWNEPNIDREWPEGQISGATYANLLAASYGAIKSNRGSTMVISAAPAPTGAENAYPGKVVNDDRWISQMVQAGGLNNMDCLGAHYNEGIVPPRATSGDPRGDYYTRFLPSMVDVYWGLTGGTKPICFTELGYLTPEGYPPLDPYFSWGANTSLAEHAAWLADAAALLSQSGRVRMMIVWNVDFTVYGSDPQGGFAMIRPDGSCPACDALAGAR